MIISGGSRMNWRYFARHLMNAEQNEEVRVAEIRGLAADTVPDALHEMAFVASGTRCKNFFYHAALNPREDEELTPEQWEQAADETERELGLEGQPRVRVQHVKIGRDGKERIHEHVIWSRIDPDTMTALSDSLNYQKHERASRTIEEAFGLEPVESVLVKDREGPRPDRRPANWEKFRGYESGIDPEDVKRELTDIWQSADTGQAFKAALEEQGFILARGDRRDFVVIDQAGDDHSLTRRIKGARAADIRARMADVDKASLPTVAEARELAMEAMDDDAGGVSILTREPEPGGDRPRPSGNAEPEAPPDTRPQGALESVGGWQKRDITTQAALTADWWGTSAPGEEDTRTRLEKWREFFSQAGTRAVEFIKDETSGTPAPDAEREGWRRALRIVKDAAVSLWEHGENRKAVVELGQELGDEAAELAAKGWRELVSKDEADKTAGRALAAEEERLPPLNPELERYSQMPWADREIAREQATKGTEDADKQAKARPAASIEDEVARQFGEVPELTPDIADELAGRFGDKPHWTDAEPVLPADDGGQSPEPGAPQSGPEPDEPGFG